MKELTQILDRGSAEGPPLASLPDTFKMRGKSAKEAGGEREGKNS